MYKSVLLRTYKYSEQVCIHKIMRMLTYAYAHFAQYITVSYLIKGRLSSRDFRLHKFFSQISFPLPPNNLLEQFRIFYEKFAGIFLSKDCSCVAFGWRFLIGPCRLQRAITTTRNRQMKQGIQGPKKSLEGRI